jgi:hypothetical protein
VKVNLIIKLECSTDSDYYDIDFKNYRSKEKWINIIENIDNLSKEEKKGVKGPSAFLVMENFHFLYGFKFPLLHKDLFWTLLSNF